ncbi:PorP/SprF family type IX secretion system membrane protein [Aquimarina algiphila]|uniref:PorP/SprF family type IX secretion system membrane protein n=1 Tax=Aquimarina algiphila TaxID=2047982 RepID=UPI00232B8A7C|nr:type IX secretion system membrane protein PorP/SprF [Aquimarina algiphila]
MKKLLLFTFIITCFIPFSNYGQQDSQYTQYMYNTVSFNPAYAGSRGVLSVMGLYRSQWLGLDGAPNTQTLTINSPINERKKLGIGLSIINDAIGAANETNFNASASYTISVSDIGKLSFGLNAGGTLLNVDLSTLRRFNTDDSLLENDIDNKFSPNVGLGLYYRTNRFYAGISAPNLLETKHFNKKTLSSINTQASVFARERINYYLITGHVFELIPFIKFKPALLTKYTVGSPIQLDLSVNVMFNEKFTVGTSYRWSKAFSAVAGFQISERVMIGFAYDREVTDLGQTRFNNGTYEAILRFELKNIHHEFLTPRFF